MLIPLISKSKLFSTTFKNVYLASYYCTNKPANTSQPEKPSERIEIHRKLFPPNNFEKKMLVWTGRYKKIEDIPDTVPVEQIEKARNKTRIKVANYMMLATLIGCFIMVQTGKRAAERGESVSQMNLDWHKKINEEAKSKNQ